MRTIFWNVDTQYDFMRPQGKLYVAGSEKIEKNLARLTKLAREKRLMIINTADWHNQHSKEISDKPNFKTTFPAHCLTGTAGAEFIKATKPQEPYTVGWLDKGFSQKKLLSSREIVLYKDEFDIFSGSPHTDKILSIIKAKQAVVYGVTSDVCVNFSVLGLLKRRIKVIILIDAIKELPGANVKKLFNIWQKRGAVLAKTNA
jgi:nicotinamidase/pyrazinamidase